MSAPGKPTEVGAKIVGTTITISWKAPTGGDVPTEYRLRRGLEREALQDLPSVPATTTSYEDKALGPGTYYYAVVAKNAGGDSDASDVTEATIDSPAIEMSLTTFLVWGLVVIGGLYALHQVLPFPKIPEPTNTLASVSGSVGAYLVRFGVVLLVAAFIPALIELFARTFHIRAEFKLPSFGRTRMVNGVGEVFLGVVGQLPDLLRRPAGYGVALVLLGVLLLVGSAFGFGGGDAGAGASPSPGIESPGPGTPSPETREPGTPPAST